MQENTCICLCVFVHVCCSFEPIVVVRCFGGGCGEEANDDDKDDDDVDDEWRWIVFFFVKCWYFRFYCFPQDNCDWGGVVYNAVSQVSE